MVVLLLLLLLLFAWEAAYVEAGRVVEALVEGLDSEAGARTATRG